MIGHPHHSHAHAVSWGLNSPPFAQGLHGPAPRVRGVAEEDASLRQRLLGLAPVPGTAWPLAFDHVATYGALYYAYVQCGGTVAIPRAHAASGAGTLARA
jgi:hypothetical protein